nr:SAM-dependent methyltransferase [Lysobacter sp. CAU 1642]
MPPPSDEALAHSERLRAGIAGHIREEGGYIPFSRFMELALYAPGLGYYSAGATKFGEAGDFITSPELGPLFGRCIGNAASRAFAGLDTPEWVELGGGSGSLAEVLLQHWEATGSLPRRYRILEPSADLRQRQRERLKARLSPALFQRLEWLDGPPAEAWSGVLFANEVLDALPTTRFVIGEDGPEEEGVALDEQGAFRIVTRPADNMLIEAVRNIESRLDAPLPRGYRSEALVQLPWWLRAVVGPMRDGLALFVDYGYPRREYYLGERRDGTLVCHYRHRAHNEPFHLPGLTDLSAFVDFTAVAEAGVAAGFELAGYCTQASFLLGNGLEQELAAPAADERAQRRRNEEARKLVLPGEMGERFKVIGLQRGIDVESLFALGDLSNRL